MNLAPGRDEAAEYYFTYINQVPAGDVGEILETQLADTLALLKGISEEKSHHRYAPDKWTIKEVVAHINDTERVFAFRAFWFGRGLKADLPTFDQDVAAASAGAGDRPLASLAEEFRIVRAATLSVFRHLPADAWSRRGVASGHPVSVRALAYIAAGHVAHHVRLLHERYL
jgi:hypothetical protein